MICGTFLQTLVSLLVAENCTSPSSPGSRASVSTAVNVRCQVDDVYYEKTGKCYGLGLQGPCNALMVMTATGRGKKGACACKHADHCESDRMLGYWNQTDRCYYAFDQGPCPQGKWFVPLAGTKKFFCKRIPCRERYEAQDPPPQDIATKAKTDFLFSYRGACYQQSTQGNCPAGENIFFSSWTHLPSCSEGIFCHQAIGRIGRMKCAGGTARDATGGCSPLADTMDYE